jgi:hypothetical protein
MKYKGELHIIETMEILGEVRTGLIAYNTKKKNKRSAKHLPVMDQYYR